MRGRDALDAGELAIAAISVAEYRVGIELADTPGRAAGRARARRAGAPRGAHDLIIAAPARQADRTVLTFGAKARLGELPGVSAAEP